MRLPPLVAFTKFPSPEQPAGAVLLRADTIMGVERAYLKMEQKPIPGSNIRTVTTPDRRIEGTVLALANGTQAIVTELVEEVQAKLREAGKPRFLGWLFA